MTHSIHNPTAAQEARRREKLLQIALERTTPTDGVLREAALEDFTLDLIEQVKFWRTVAYCSLTGNIVLAFGVAVLRHVGGAV